MQFTLCVCEHRKTALTIAKPTNVTPTPRTNQRTPKRAKSVSFCSGERMNGGLINQSYMFLVAAAAAAEHDCPKPRTEIKLNSIIAGLFAESNVPEGSIIDVGALDGAFSCFYASIAPQRTVHALDPTEANVQMFRRRYSHKFPNIQPMVGALGEKRATISSVRLPKQMNGAMTQVTDIHVAAAAAASSGGKNKVSSSSDEGIQLYAADELFETRWRGERLGFAHIDVEGSELSVLRGMEKQIRKDKPLFTVEVHVHFKPEFTRDLVAFIEGLGYDAHLVEESCGESSLLCGD